MQAIELVGEGVDGDFDGVVDELTIGDQTALAVYLAAQPRPTTRLELDALGLLEPPPHGRREEPDPARREPAVRAASSAASRCHRATLTLDDPIVQRAEPERRLSRRGVPGGSGSRRERRRSASAPFASTSRAISPTTCCTTPTAACASASARCASIPAAARRSSTSAAISSATTWGRACAESVDEKGTGASVFLTENLWGVGSTAPYLHDGRATTLTEAILEHGGEAATSKNNFLRLSTQDQADVIAYLDNLVLFKLPERTSRGRGLRWLPRPQLRRHARAGQRAAVHADADRRARAARVVEHEVEQAVAVEIAEADHAGRVEGLADRARIERRAGRAEVDLELVAVGRGDQIEPAVVVQILERGQEADRALRLEADAEVERALEGGLRLEGRAPARGGRCAAADRSSA